MLLHFSLITMIPRLYGVISRMQLGYIIQAWPGVHANPMSPSRVSSRSLAILLFGRVPCAHQQYIRDTTHSNRHYQLVVSVRVVQRIQTTRITYTVAPCVYFTAHALNLKDLRM